MTSSPDTVTQTQGQQSPCATSGDDRMMVEIAGGVVMPRREVEQQIAQALHLAHGSPGTTCCFLCRLDARVVVSALNAGAVLATVAAAVVV